MNDIDKWYAEQCGVEVSRNGMCRIDYSDGGSELAYWTISDPRCREVCRERLNVYTDKVNGKWSAHQHLETDRYYDDSIAEAEIACLQSIYEARDE